MKNFACKYRMKYPSEWAKFFDERTRRYRYKHKGSGVIRDTLMAIGKAFKSSAKSVAKSTTKKAAQVAAEKAGQKIGEKTAEKGAEMIQKILRNRRTPSSEAAMELNQILENKVGPSRQVSSREAMRKLNQILANQL